MECVLCQTISNETNPLGLLQCGHSFCTVCLNTQLQLRESSKCATCQTGFQFSDIVCQAKATKFIESSEPKLCCNCADIHPATMHCVDCDDYFCDLMGQCHLRQKSTINHKVISLHDDKEECSNHRRLNNLQFKECPKHNRPFEFLNLNSPANNHLLCSDCLIGDLPSLNLVRLGESTAPLMEEKLEHIRELSKLSSKHLSELQEEEEFLSSRLGEMEQSKERSLGEIRRVFSSLREALDFRQFVLEQVVEEKSKSFLFSLSEERERSRVWQDQLRNLGECAEEIEAWVRSQPQSQSLPSLSLQSSMPASWPSNKKIFDKGLMVDVCLLEDALRNSLSSSQASCSLKKWKDLSLSLNLCKDNIGQEGSGDEKLDERDSRLLDLLTFSFTFLHRILPSPPSIDGQSSIRSLELFLEGISKMGSVTSSLTQLLSPSRMDWSENYPQQVISFYSNGSVPNQLSQPTFVTYSPESKRFFVADYTNNRIQVFRNNPQAEREGRLEIEYLPALKTSPYSVTYPSCVYYHQEFLFIVETTNSRIRVFREDGSYVTSIGNSSSALNGQFSNPYGCTVFKNHLFVSDQGNNRIQKFSLPEYKHVFSFGSKGTEVGQISSPSGLTVFNGKLYVADSNNRLSVFDPDTGSGLSVISPFLSNGETLSSPRDLLVSHNLLFVSSNHRISVFNANDQYLYSFGTPGSGEGEFSQPKGMVMVEERLFVCDSQNNRVQVFGNLQKEIEQGK